MDRRAQLLMAASRFIGDPQITGIARTSSGLLHHNNANAVIFPQFDKTQWTPPADITVGNPNSNGLPLSSGISNVFTRYTLFNVLPNQPKALIQITVGALATGGGIGVGFILDNTADSVDGTAFGGPAGFSGDLSLGEWVGGIVNTSQSVAGKNYDRFAFHRMTLSVDGLDIAGHIGTDNTTISWAREFDVGGRPGLLYSSGSQNSLSYSSFIYCTGRFVHVAGLPTGAIVKVRKDDGTTIASAVEAGGEAFVDMLTIDLHLGATNKVPYDLAIFDADGVTLLAVNAPVGGVWPGDEWETTFG